MRGKLALKPDLLAINPCHHNNVSMHKSELLFVAELFIVIVTTLDVRQVSGPVHEGPVGIRVYK